MLSDIGDRAVGLPIWKQTAVVGMYYYYYYNVHWQGPHEKVQTPEVELSS